MPHPPNYLTGSPIKKIDMDNKEDFAIDEINREQDRWNYIEAQLEGANKQVRELEKKLNVANSYTNDWSSAAIGWNSDNNKLRKRVAELENELAEIRDLARTGTPPDAYGMTSLEEWEHYKINKIAGMANEALNKDQEVQG